MAEVLKTNNMKKNSAFQLRSGNKPSPAELSGISPMKDDKKKKQKKTESEFIKNISEYSENLPYIKPILTKEEEEKQKELFKNMPKLGPAPLNPNPDSFINTPKSTKTKKKKK